MLYSVILALVSINFCTAASRLQIRFPCNDQEALCVPAELRKLKAPSIDSGIDGLLHDLLISIGLTSIAERDVKQVEGTLVKRAPTDHVCCPFGFGCYYLRHRQSPFCYDEFTYDFVLPGNFTGNINTGRYESSDGDRANLHNGNYILKDGTSGNIYDHANPKAHRDITSIPFPTKFSAPKRPTSSPLEFETELITIKGTTRAAKTFLPATTIPPLIQDGETLLPTITYHAIYLEGTTKPESVITITRPVTRLGEPVGIGAP